MALNYLKCLLRFGPGFTCWAIWESWAACSVVPCTADVCEGVTELLLLLLCTSSIINYKKSNELNSVNDKFEQQVGTQLPLTLYRISVHNAFSLIWTFLISSLSFDITFYYGIAQHFLWLPLQYPEHCYAFSWGQEGKGTVGAFPLTRPVALGRSSTAPGTPPLEASEPGAARTPILERETRPVLPWQHLHSNCLSAPVQTYPVLKLAVKCIYWFPGFCIKINKVKSWDLGRKPR